MKRAIATLVLFGLTITWLFIWKATELPECDSDDGSSDANACIWHADRHGNGQGDSFWIDEKGEVHYI